ncbi:MAG: glycine--tRNA ligase [Candidatus Diapherotrites archaeon]|nr:glycine--tRNA ligase [Candidatus Diapherotrites archaeon]
MTAEDIVNLALRRSLFFPASEIYSNSPSGFWDFGPIGTKMRFKVLDFWRKNLVESLGFLEIHGAQILSEDVFRASGHLSNFADPIVKCKKCQTVFRADQLIQEHIGSTVAESLSTPELDSLIQKHQVPCKKCKSKEFENVRKFNMMMGIDVGATGQQKGYLRPETAQNIFVDFARVFKTSRKNLPLGIAQVGASFRNEIAPRNTLLRERELGQMEIEVFFNPKKINEVSDFGLVQDYKLNLLLQGKKEVSSISCKESVEKNIVSGKLIAFYLAKVQQVYSGYGFPSDKIRFRELDKDERAFYAKETWDFEVKTSHGWIELIANNYRTDYDLGRHAEGSKQDLSVTEDGEKFIPHVFEISAGIDRTLYCLLDTTFIREKRGQGERVILNLPVQVAPYLCAVFPLMTKDGLQEKGKEIFQNLLGYHLDVLLDEKDAIGRRYARIEEIGVPFAVTVDYDTLQDQTVTLRYSKTTEQKRVKIADLPELLWKLSIGKTTFETI